MTATDVNSEIDAFDRAMAAGGPSTALDQLMARARAERRPRPLLDALLLKARHDLGLPTIAGGPLADLPEPGRTRYEERYVEALREVGGILLADGEIAAAWPYYRAIGEPEAVARAIDEYTMDHRLDQVVEVAFNQGANPRRGFALILENYGACAAISAYSGLPDDNAVRVEAVDRLVRALHAQLIANLRAELGRSDVESAETTIDGLLAAVPGLMDDDAYHIDVSHLSAVVRLSPLLVDPAAIRLALELTDYGRALGPLHRSDDDPPFADTYADHAQYLRALVGEDVEAALAHLRLAVADADGDTIPAQVLVKLLDRLGRADEAIEVADAHLAEVPEGSLGCPGLSTLCRASGRPGRLAESCRRRGDAVGYAAARLAVDDR